MRSRPGGRSTVASERRGGVAGQVRTLLHLGAVGDSHRRPAAGAVRPPAGARPAELAFAALVERHGPMVLRVCRAVLARRPRRRRTPSRRPSSCWSRRARSLWVRDSIGPWLHQVACRVAVARPVAAARRRRHERRAAERARDAHRARRPRTTSSAVLHEELARLPERYRAAGGPLRPGGPVARAGGPAPGLAGRDGQEPPGPGPRALRGRLARRGLAPAAGLGSSCQRRRGRRFRRRLSIPRKGLRPGWSRSRWPRCGGRFSRCCCSRRFGCWGSPPWR